MARHDPVPRVLPRRHGRGARSFAPDGLDRPGGRPHPAPGRAAVGPVPGGSGMSDQVDVIVIGAGPPGENAAGRAADGGLSVAIVEERLVGGECTFYGCIPSKTLIRPGDVIAAARRVPGAAEAVTGSIDAQAALVQRDYMTSSWSDRTQTPWLDSKGIELFRGHGRLAGERAVEVALSDGSGVRRLTARRAVVMACGTTPAMPPIDGLRDAHP